MSNKIQSEIIMTINVHNIWNIPIIVTDRIGKILAMTHIPKAGASNYTIRKLLRCTIDDLIKRYSVDTILLEQNQLYIDKIDRYPDPIVMRNVLLGYGINITIEDTYLGNVRYILEIPRYEWKKIILNSKVEYAVDLYKSHILLRTDIDSSMLSVIENNNYYEALCMSEIIFHKKLLNEKYLLSV